MQQYREPLPLPLTTKNPTNDSSYTYPNRNQNQELQLQPWCITVKGLSSLKDLSYLKCKTGLINTSFQQELKWKPLRT